MRVVPWLVALHLAGCQANQHRHHFAVSPDVMVTTAADLTSGMGSSPTRLHDTGVLGGSAQRRLLGESEDYLRPTKPPNPGAAPNCPKCEKLSIPDKCSYVPRSALGRHGKGSSVVGKQSSSGNTEPEAESGGDSSSGEYISGSGRRLLLDEGEGRMGRKLLQSRRRSGGVARARAGRRAGGSSGRRGGGGGRSRQREIIPPSAGLKEQLVTSVKSWGTWDKGPKGDPSQLCGIWTRDCVEAYLGGNHMDLYAFKEGEPFRRHPLLKNFKGGKLPDNWKDMFPDIRSGGLGTCAVVAVGENVLGQGRGKDIDDHDTIFRYNAPIKKFVKDVGSRADIYYWKVRKDEKDYGVEGQKASRFYMFKEPAKFFMFGKPNEVKTNRYRGLPVIWTSGRSTPLGTLVYGTYKAETRAKTGSPAGGYKFALDVISSGLCTRVDLYGYTALGTGKYFARAKLMKTVHISGVEHWTYRVLQEQGAACVYD